MNNERPPGQGNEPRFRGGQEADHGSRRGADPYAAEAHGAGHPAPYAPGDQDAGYGNRGGAGPYPTPAHGLGGEPAGGAAYGQDGFYGGAQTGGYDPAYGGQVPGGQDVGYGSAGDAGAYDGQVPGGRDPGRGTPDLSDPGGGGTYAYGEQVPGPSGGGTYARDDHGAEYGSAGDAGAGAYGPEGAGGHGTRFPGPYGARGQDAGYGNPDSARPYSAGAHGFGGEPAGGVAYGQDGSYGRAEAGDVGAYGQQASNGADPYPARAYGPGRAYGPDGTGGHGAGYASAGDGGAYSEQAPGGAGPYAAQAHGLGGEPTGDYGQAEAAGRDAGQPAPYAPQGRNAGHGDPDGAGPHPAPARGSGGAYGSEGAGFPGPYGPRGQDAGYGSPDSARPYAAEAHGPGAGYGSAGDGGAGPYSVQAHGSGGEPAGALAGPMPGYAEAGGAGWESGAAQPQAGERTAVLPVVEGVPEQMAGRRRETGPEAPVRSGSPIIAPGMQPAGLTAALGLLMAGGAAVGKPGLAAVLVVLQAVTAAGWFRLNGMWPARQGIALAFLSGVTADIGLLTANGDHGPAVLVGTLGVWLLLVLVLQLRHHGSADERMSSLTATSASTLLTVLAAGYLATATSDAGSDPVVAGAVAVALAAVVRALPLPGAASVVVSLLAAAATGLVTGPATGMSGGDAVAVAAAGGVCALIGLRVASYDFPSRFVHFTAGVALPLTAAAPAVYLLGRALTG
jgi:hypothetical protein